MIALFVEHRSPHVETVRGTQISACEDVPLHAEKDLRMWNNGLRMRRQSFARRTSVSACGSTRHAEDNEKSAVLGFRNFLYHPPPLSSPLILLTVSRVQFHDISFTSIIDVADLFSGINSLRVFLKATHFSLKPLFSRFFSLIHSRTHHDFLDFAI